MNSIQQLHGIVSHPFSEDDFDLLPVPNVAGRISIDEVRTFRASRSSNRGRSLLRPGCPLQTVSVVDSTRNHNKARVSRSVDQQQGLLVGTGQRAFIFANVVNGFVIDLLDYIAM
jgi:hypothetical protein